MKTTITISMVVLLASIMSAYADENLGAIDVTPSTSKQTSQIAALNTVTIIDRELIEGTHATDVVDVLKGAAGVVVSDTSGVGAKSRVDLGGFGEAASANTVVLIDGRRVNSPDLSGTDWTQIPLDQIERIEIAHGGGTTLYGDGAVGGAINIVTRIPESGGRMSIDVGSFGSSGVSLRTGADSGRMRVESNFSTSKSEGYRRNALFERVDAGVRAEGELNDHLSFRASGNYHKDRAGLPGPLSAAQVAADRKQSSNLFDVSQTSDSFIDAGVNWVGRGLELDLSGGVRDRKTYADYISFGSISDIGIRTHSIRPKLNYSISGTMPVQLMIGADLDESRALFEYGGAFPLPVSTIKRKRSGYFGRSVISAEDGGWSVTVGARSEGINDSFSQGSTTRVNERKTVWELAASAAVTDMLQLRMSTGSSVRFPLLDERYSFFSGTVDAALKPQSGINYAAGLRYAMDHAWLDIALSRTELTDEIYYNPIGGAFGFGANENYTDKTRRDVAMISGHFNGGELQQFSGNITYVNATFRGGLYGGKTIPAGAKVRAGANWQADWSKQLNTLLKLTYVGDSYLISDQANIRAKLPSYLLVDVVMNYQMDDIQFFARIDNLTNEKYSSYGVYSVFTGDNFYPAAGIGLRVGASYHF